jgi:hypothetical protein
VADLRVAVRRTAEQDEASLGLVDLQKKIAARVDHGGSLADVRQEIIEPSSLGGRAGGAVALRGQPIPPSPCPTMKGQP